MRARSPPRAPEPQINARRAATIAAVTAAILPIAAPPVAASAPGPSPTDTGSLNLADLRAVVAARAAAAQRANRSLYPAPSFRARTRPSTQAAQTLPPAPVVPVVAYIPKHAAPPKKTVRSGYGNGGQHYPAPISGSASAIVQFALTLQGRPYEWGAAGPWAFDCSGLIDYVFAHFGIRLPHKASAFYGVGRAVPASQIQPGDILVLDGGGHAALALGNGLMLHAPHSGDHVRIAPIWSFSAARRVL